MTRAEKRMETLTNAAYLRTIRPYRITYLGADLKLKRVVLYLSLKERFDGRLTRAYIKRQRKELTPIMWLSWAYLIEDAKEFYNYFV